jgi:hypothetical protein
VVLEVISYLEDQVMTNSILEQEMIYYLEVRVQITLIVERVTIP